MTATPSELILLYKIKRAFIVAKFVDKHLFV